MRWGARSYLVVVRKGAFTPQDEQENPFLRPLARKSACFPAVLSLSAHVVYMARAGHMAGKNRDEKADKKTPRKVRKLIPVALVSSA